VDWKEKIKETYFDTNNPHSLWRQVINMYEDHIIYKTITFAKELEPNKELVIFNKYLNGLLQTGYICGQSLYIRRFTEESENKISIPSLIAEIKKNDRQLDLKSIECDISEKTQPALKEVRIFSHNYIAHLAINPTVRIKSFEEFVKYIEKCHLLIRCSLQNLYALLYQSLFVPKMAYCGNINEKLHGYFISAESQKRVYEYFNTLIRFY